MWSVQNLPLLLSIPWNLWFYFKPWVTHMTVPYFLSWIYGSRLNRYKVQTVFLNGRYHFNNVNALPTIVYTRYRGDRKSKPAHYENQSRLVRVGILSLKEFVLGRWHATQGFPVQFSQGPSYSGVGMKRHNCANCSVRVLLIFVFKQVILNDSGF